MTVLFLGVLLMALFALLMDVAALVMLLNASSLTDSLYAVLSTLRAPAAPGHP